MLIAASAIILAALHACAIWFAWRAIVSARTPQGAVAWVVFLLAAPYFAVIPYVFLGHHRYRGYMIARQSSAEVVAGVRRLAAPLRPATRPRIDPTPFERIAEMPAVRGNALVPLIDGQASFEAIFAAIDAAERYVLVQFFIVHDDEIGRAFHDRLTAAAARGVTVRFMADAVGSKSLPAAYVEGLRRAGVHVADPRRQRRPRQRLQLNYRNHRKTVVVDGRTGFTGGLNVGDEYLGRDPVFGAWRDTHMEIRGPAVSQLQLVFVEDWHWADGALIIDELAWDVPPDPADMTALVVPTGPADRQETGALFFFSAIAAARERVWIASPYCVPDTDILTALKHAAMAGRDVRLLVPEVIDHYAPWLAAFAYFDELREAGVEIWRYREGFMHQKVILIDDACAAIGTANLDNRSFRLNFETMVVGFDAGFAGAVAGFLERDFARATRLEKRLAQQSVRLRYGAPVARLLAPLL